MTIISESAVKTAAAKYVAAYVAADDDTANEWLIDWAITKRVWFKDKDHLLSGSFHNEICNDA